MALAEEQAAPRYDRIRMVMGGTSTGAAGVLRDSLASRGMNRVVTCNGKVDNLYEALDAEIVDVLVYDYDNLGSEFGAVMQGIRRKVRGQNPFVVIVATAKDSALATVRQLINAGVDDLIRKPISIDRLFDSVNRFAQKRKPFTIGHDYIGPVRRSSRRRGRGASSQLVRVPNTLRSRAIEGASDEEIVSLVETAIARFEAKRTESYGEAIENLTHDVVAHYADPNGPQDRFNVHRALMDLEIAADELRVRLDGIGSDRVSDLASILIALVHRINRVPHGKAVVEVQLLGKLGIAINRALSVESDAVGVMKEISATVSGFVSKH